MTTPADFLGSAWCADADGAGGFSNWVRTADPSTCVNATSGTGTWYLMPLADAQGLVSFAAASGSGTPSSPATFTSNEIAALKYQAANPSPFNLTLTDGGLVAGAVLGCWAVGVCIREIARVINSGGDSQE
jgi:hypothetical protein